MHIKNIGIYLAFSGLLFTSTPLLGQETKLSAQQILELALENQKELKVSRYNTAIAQSKTNEIQLEQLPRLSFNASAAYLGDAEIYDKNFSHVATSPVPNFGNSFAVTASQLLYKGGVINKSIEAAKIGEQLSELDYLKDEQAIKFIVLSNYLDLYKLQNQLLVYQNNKSLAQERLDNVMRFYKQDLVTKNEVIRGELALAQIDQGVLAISNNLEIVNFNLTTAIGLPTHTKIVPTQQLITEDLELEYEYYLTQAYQHHPMFGLASKSVELAHKKVQIAKSDYLPSLAAIAGYNMTRPITSVTPIADMYSNTYQVGLSLSYDIDNLYRTPKKVKTQNLVKQQAQEQLDLVAQQVEMQVHAAYTKYNEAIKNAAIALKSQELALENYHIIEAKYLHQLAIQAEMTDATNAKLEAEIQYVNAQINILFQHYSLLKATGSL